MKRVVGLMALVLLSACSESFLAAWAVTDLRAVAGRVDVEGEPERANPSAGEPVQVSILVIDQGAPPSEFPEIPALTPGLLQWGFVACIPEPTLFGPPICRDRIEPCEGCVATPPTDPLALPLLRFTAPSQEELDAANADSLVVQGAICAGGPPAQDAILRFILGETDDLNPCEDPSNEGRFVTVSIPIERDVADPNLNPMITTVTLDGSAWPPPYDTGVSRTAPRTGCVEDLAGLSPEEQAAHPVAAGPPMAINLLISPESLQTYAVEENEVVEEIQVSWLADGGGYERTFSFITDPARSVLTQWQPFSSAPEDGTLVRFNFVIRDGRGGTHWVERGLCVRPAPATETPP